MRPENPRILNPKQYRFLLAALFITGASTLILEIVGTRVISPYYGSSLYCWSALITVTLVSLAAGYNLGGRQADAAASLMQLSRLITAAGAAVALIPLCRLPVLRWTTTLGVQLGALASATALMAPALVLLSALGPLAVRLTVSELSNVGKSAGDVYAVSTLGSVLGAILAGFILIPRVPITEILCALAVILLLLGALGHYLSTLRIPWRQPAAAAAVALIGFWPRSAPSTNVLLNEESAYGQIKIMDFGGKRYLLVNGTSQSIATLPASGGAQRMESDSPYIHSLEAAALLRPAARRALAIGLGAGLLPGAFESVYGIVADAVDIDPAIISAARRYFNFSPAGEVFAEDGRSFIERAGRRYDIIVLDAFGAESPPFHLFTQEAFTAISRALSPGGVLTINLVSLVAPPHDKTWLAAYKTLRSVFPEVRAFIANKPYHNLANILFFCSGDPLAIEKLKGLGRPLIREDMAYTFAHEITPAESDLARVPVMSDDYAPMESLLARTAVIWRRTLQENMGSILLY